MDLIFFYTQKVIKFCDGECMDFDQFGKTIQIFIVIQNEIQKGNCKAQKQL